MARRRLAKKRKISPDIFYKSRVVAKLINRLMNNGKKSRAEFICYESFKIIEKKLKKNSLEVFLTALENVKPVIEVRSRRVGGATYQVPAEVRLERQEMLALKWMITFAHQRKGKSMEEKLAEEIIAAFKGGGLAIKRREDTYRMAEANRAFAHYRW